MRRKRKIRGLSGSGWGSTNWYRNPLAWLALGASAIVVNAIVEQKSKDAAASLAPLFKS